jgi:hypothetical protein
MACCLIIWIQGKFYSLKTREGLAVVKLSKS